MTLRRRSITPAGCKTCGADTKTSSSSSCACTSRSRERPSAGRGSSTTPTSTGATISARGSGSRASFCCAWPIGAFPPRPRSSTRSSRNTLRTSCAGPPSARGRPRARRIARWRAASRCPSATRTGPTGASWAAIHALVAASRPHSFLGVDGAGRVAIVRTAGNPDGHIVLRGGNAGPNYAAEHVAAAAARAREGGRAVAHARRLQP